MPVNERQKIAIIDNNSNIKTTIDNALLNGYVILLIVNLAPSQAKVLIVYCLPEEIL